MWVFIFSVRSLNIPVDKKTQFPVRDFVYFWDGAGFKLDHLAYTSLVLGLLCATMPASSEGFHLR